MRFAYADPPYPGQSKRHYGNHRDYGGEVDHAALIESLVTEYPDGWALSTDARSLRWLWPMTPEGTRVGIWTKGFASWKKGVYPPYAWEPVIFAGGRNRFGEVQSPRDWVQAIPPVFRGKGSDTKGQKPTEFCFWVFDFLGAMEGDELDDLFPGSGAVSHEWLHYLASPRIDFPPAHENQGELEAA